MVSLFAPADRHFISVLRPDFCVWGSQITDGELEVVGDIEGEMVAVSLAFICKVALTDSFQYCTKPGYGTRVLPPGAITGVQFTQTPGYVQGQSTC